MAAAIRTLVAKMVQLRKQGCGIGNLLAKCTTLFASAGSVVARVGVLPHGPNEAKGNAAGALSHITASEQYSNVVMSADAMW